MSQPHEREPSRAAALKRGEDFTAQAEEMERLAEAADLPARAEIFRTAGRRFRALAQMQMTVSKSEPRTWAGDGEA